MDYLDVNALCFGFEDVEDLEEYFSDEDEAEAEADEKESN